jgi:tetratricopeptide (TPR) repeat protein
VAVAANDRGVAQMKSNDVDGAIRSFDEAIRLAPSYALPQFNRGLALSARKQWEAAMASFDAAIKIDPASQRTYYFRSEARRENGDLPGARADLDESVRLDPKHADSWLSRGVVSNALGQHRRRRGLRSAILDPGRAGSRAARVAWEVGDTEGPGRLRRGGQAGFEALGHC